MRKSPEMKSLLPILVAALAVLGITACGENRHNHSDKSVVQASSGIAAVGEGRSETDKDDDADSAGASYYDRDDQRFLHYGHVADGVDGRAVTALVRRYYAVAARADGAAACRLISSAVARAGPQEYAGALGKQAPPGETCAVAMSELLGRLYGQSSEFRAKLKVGVVRVEGNSGHALLSFDEPRPKRYMLVRREHGVWRINALLDTAMP
jgi:hypothetical protein